MPDLFGGGGFQVANLTRVATGAGGAEDVEWRGEIPASAVTTTGVDYFLEADSNGTTTKYPGTPFVGGVQPIGVFFHAQTVSPPLIAHAPVTFGFADQPLNIDAQVSCSTGNCRATLYYRVGYAIALPWPWTSTGMEPQGAGVPLGDAGTLLTLRGQVPASAVTTQGVDYYIEVGDGHTRTFSPGTPYQGYYAPRDGVAASDAPHHVHVLEPPHVAHVPVVTAPYRQDIPISAAGNCPASRQCQATLHYRTTPAGHVVTYLYNIGTFASTPMTVRRVATASNVDAVTLDGVIPAGVADTRGVDYFITLTDGSTTGGWPSTDELFYQHIRVQEPPHITPTQPPAAAAHQDLPIQAEMTCATESCSATLHYSQQPVLPGATYQAIAMTRTGVQATTSASRLETWQAVIPASQVTTRGLAYYITATDGYTHTAAPGTTYWGAYYPIGGGTASPETAAFVVRVVDPPHPVHKPVGVAFTGEPVAVQAGANCAADSCPATLHWRITGQGWQSTAMDASAPMPLAYGNALRNYQAVIPGGSVTTTGLEYRVEVTDGDTTETTPTWPIAVADRPAGVPPVDTTTPTPTVPETIPTVTVPPVTTPPVSVPPPPPTTIPPPPATVPPVTTPPPPPTTLPPPPVTVPLPPPTTVPVTTTLPTVTTVPVPTTIPPPPVTIPPPPPGVLPPVVTDAIAATRAAAGCVRPSPNAELRNYDDLEQILQDLSDAAMVNYSGAYIGVDQNVHVAVVGEAGRAALPTSLTTDPRVVVEQAKFAVDRLDATMTQIAGRLNSALASAPQPEGTWPWQAAVSLSCNTIDIVLDPSALPKLDAAVQAIGPELIEGIARITGVEPVRFADAACPRDDCSPARAGLTAGRSSLLPCTLGFITRDDYGRREAFTAGHCGSTPTWTVGGIPNSGSTVRQPCSPNCPDRLDYQVISLHNPNEPVASNLVWRQETDAAPVTLRIDDPRKALENTVVCSSGWKGFQSCGELTNWNSSADEGLVGYGRFRTTACQGDSGGPVFNKTNTRAYGLATAIAQPADRHEECYRPVYFTWTANAQQHSGRRVLLTSTTETLAPNQRMQPGTRTGELRSRDGRFRLVMQPADGNLVLYHGSTAHWSLLDYPGTPLVAGSYAVMQDDGNFVVRKPDGTAIWDWDSYSTTPKVAGAFVMLQDDRNLVVRTESAAQWSMGTVCGC